MKNTKQLLLACVIASTSMAAAAADMGPYAGAGLGQYKWEEASFTLLEGDAGYKFNPFFAVEAQLGLSIAGDEFNSVDFDLDYFAVYAKPQYSFSDVFSLYALLGFANTELTLSDSANEVSGSATEFSYGVGANFILSEQLDIAIEWKQLSNPSEDLLENLGIDSRSIDTSGVDDPAGFSVGVSFKF